MPKSRPRKSQNDIDTEIAALNVQIDQKKEALRDGVRELKEVRDRLKILYDRRPELDRLIGVLEAKLREIPPFYLKLLRRLQWISQLNYIDYTYHQDEEITLKQKKREVEEMSREYRELRRGLKEKKILTLREIHRREQFADKLAPRVELIRTQYEELIAWRVQLQSLKKSSSTDTISPPDKPEKAKKDDNGASRSTGQPRFFNKPGSSENSKTQTKDSAEVSSLTDMFQSSDDPYLSQAISYVCSAGKNDDDNDSLYAQLTRMRDAGSFSTEQLSQLKQKVLSAYGEHYLADHSAEDWLNAAFRERVQSINPGDVFELPGGLTLTMNNNREIEVDGLDESAGDKAERQYFDERRTFETVIQRVEEAVARMRELNERAEAILATPLPDDLDGFDLSLG